MSLLAVCIKNVDYLWVCCDLNLVLLIISIMGMHIISKMSPLFSGYMLCTSKKKIKRTVKKKRKGFWTLSWQLRWEVWWIRLPQSLFDFLSYFSFAFITIESMFCPICVYYSPSLSQFASLLSCFPLSWLSSASTLPQLFPFVPD